MNTAALIAPAPQGERSRTLDDVLEGLSQQPKRLPCKLFYDEEGSRLFERITRLPEYYPTRTEMGILERHGADMAECIGPRAVLVEFGSGASHKTRLLLDRLVEPRVYVPIDISREILLSSATTVGRRYPALSVRPVVGDYMHELELPLDESERDSPIVAFFPGSTIGNFEPHEAVSFLRRVRHSSRVGAKLLVGVDLPKERATLERAYDDSERITARFNLNALRVLNRDYGARLCLEDFTHRSVWNVAKSRVEMHLVSVREHTLRIGSRNFLLREGEPIVTEHCYKHSLEDFGELVASAGYSVDQVWLDEQHRFSVQFLVPSPR
jgi:dimethylhistidine N-methyltransferase